MMVVMQFHMFLHIRGVTKTFPAHGAQKGFLPRMYPLVDLQHIFPTIHFTALMTQVTALLRL